MNKKDLYKKILNTEKDFDSNDKTWLFLYDTLKDITTPEETTPDASLFNKYQDLRKTALDSINTLVEGTDNLIQDFKDKISQLKDENQTLRLKVAQYEENTKKSISKGVAEVVTFDGIINFIESCNSVNEAFPIYMMLMKLLTFGEFEKEPILRATVAINKVRERESRNVTNNFNAPYINNGTLNGDVNNNPKKTR